MVEILQKVKFNVSQVADSSTASKGQVTKGATDTSKQRPIETRQLDQLDQEKKTVEKTVEKKKKRLRKVFTRRRRRRGNQDESSEEECEVLSSSDDESTASDDNDTLSTLSDALGEDDLEMLERLSDCSSSEDESTDDKLSSLEKTPPNLSQPLASGVSPASVPKKVKRQIILAANFSNASRPKLEETKVESELPNSASGTSVPSSHGTNSSVKQDPTSVDNSLRYLLEKTGDQSIVHSVCCLVAEESYLMSLRVFMEWIQSYPIAVASTQV